MCGISGICGTHWKPDQLTAMVSVQNHRGPDDAKTWISPDGLAGLGQDRLSIIDLSRAGSQPMPDSTGRYWITFNGEVYNYLELRRELADYPYRSHTDTEVVLAAFIQWGASCLDRFIGMFAFLIWDTETKTLFAARDRFGVKPLYYHTNGNGQLTLASEIKALFAAGVARQSDAVAWSNYLAVGYYDHSPRTFWKDVSVLPAGHLLTWKDGHLTIAKWYDLADRTAELDDRPLDVVEEEYTSLMEESIRLRFRSDVPVGINLSGGLDSSVLLGVVRKVQGEASTVKAFTFFTGDPAYDELPWVQQMLAHTRHPSVECLLSAADVPALAHSVQQAEDEPFAGLPTLAYARLFEIARQQGVIVLLDGNGMDEQWAGYDYYETSLAGGTAGTVQGTRESPFRVDCLIPEFAAQHESFEPRKPYADKLRNLQYRDIVYTKIPRAMRFNDRISMRSSCELREPFLDHRLFEIAIRQPVERKIQNGTRKWMLRQIAQNLAPSGVVEAPKRPLQTPQREWLRGPLKEWANGHIENAISRLDGTWLDAGAVRSAWTKFCRGESDNSFYIWQWISLSLMEIGG
ncbi:MAG: asparagine synthase (glutamine-hydrolyzing) [Anaerolineaceae bacterium]